MGETKKLLIRDLVCILPLDAAKGRIREPGHPEFPFDTMAASREV
jgi:hypothetical protein